MLGVHDYWLFIATGILLNLTPGQDTMFIIGRSITDGRRAGITAALGISTGALVHTLMAAIGLSAILATSTVAFTVVKLAGAAYLVYLGVKLLMAKEPGAVMDAAPARSSAYLQGVLTNILNPKVALFFLAFLPQFIDAGAPSKPLAFLFLGATFVATGTAWCLVLALAAAKLRGFFLRNPTVRTAVDRITGAVFIGMGIRLAWAR